MKYRQTVLSALAAAAILGVVNAGAQTTQSPDSLANGIVNGALAGGGAAFAFVKIAEARCGPGCEGPDGPLAMQAALGGAAIGGTVGLLLDMAKKPKPASPSLNVGPMLSAKKKALVVRVRW